MPTRIAPFTTAVVVLACALVGPRSAAAQVERVADPNWTTPRTADGQPDLQGLWGNKTITPMERRDSSEGGAFLTRRIRGGSSPWTRRTLRRRDAPLPARTSAATGATGSTRATRCCRPDRPH